MSVPVVGIIKRIIQRVVKDFSADDVMSMSAALAFYTALSLAPLVVLVLTIGGLIWSAAEVQEELVRQASELVGKSGGDVVKTILRAAAKQDQKGLSAIVAFGGLIFGATTVFAQLQSSLNTVWNVQAKPKEGLGGVWAFLRKRLLSLGMVLAMAFLLLVSLIASTVLAYASSSWRIDLPGADAIWSVVTFAVTFAVFSGIFAAMHRFLPDVRITWRDAVIGGVITAALFTIGKELLGLYLGKASVASSYGAAGSLFVVLLWVNYSSLILFVGAEITQAFVAETGRPVQVDDAVGAKPQAEEGPRKAVQQSR